tara:strand:- start:385 stop:576 length:192 start_codon:yes stop_codon:yes gene_type:complete
MGILKKARKLLRIEPEDQGYFTTRGIRDESTPTDSVILKYLGAEQREISYVVSGKPIKKERSF